MAAALNARIRHRLSILTTCAGWCALAAAMNVVEGEIAENNIRLMGLTFNAHVTLKF